MAKRLEQVESLLKRQISGVLSHGLGDPRTEGGMITVTRVKVSPDLHDALVFVSIMPAKLESRALAALQHASRHIHRQVADMVSLRTTPRLDFRLDGSLKKQAAIYQAIARGVQRESDAGTDRSSGPPTATESPEEHRP